MKLNEFEDKQLRQINKLDKTLHEGSLGNAVLRTFFGSKFKKIMKGISQEEDYPEYQSILKNIKQQLEDIQDRYAESEKVLKQQEADNKRLEKRVRALKRRQ